MGRQATDCYDIRNYFENVQDNFIIVIILRAILSQEYTF